MQNDATNDNKSGTPYSANTVKTRGPWSVKEAHKRPQCDTALRQFLDANGLSFRAFAARLGCSWRSIQNWASGQALPNLAYAFRIEEVTGGAVPACSFLGSDLGKAAWIAAGGTL